MDDNQIIEIATKMLKDDGYDIKRMIISTPRGKHGVMVGSETESGSVLNNYFDTDTKKIYYAISATPTAPMYERYLDGVKADHPNADI